MSGYLAQKVDDLNSGLLPSQRALRMGRVASLEDLASALHGDIIGQDDAVAATVRAVAVAAAGLRDPDRPIASLLFVGPTGVGKTELARSLAREITGSADRLCRIDMNSLAQEHYAASLAGAPPGYSGSKEQFTLLDRELVEGNASRPGVVLFDEVEKAHPTVLRALLQILDSGLLTLAAGTTTISFRNTIIILTSNLGTTEVIERRQRDSSLIAQVANTFTRIFQRPQSITELITEVVESFFDPELFNRFDEVVEFTNLDREATERILRRELDETRRRLEQTGYQLSLAPGVEPFLLKRGFDQRYGARNLKRALRRDLHGPLATAALSDLARDCGHRTLAADVVNAEVIVSTSQ